MIIFDNLSFAYTQGRQILRNISLEIAEGELCLLIGTTGAGKSTLLGSVNGLVPHFTGGHLSGRVLVDGRDTREYQPQDLADVVGYVGQDPLKGFVTDTVVDEIAYAMEQLGISGVAMRKRIEETLDLMGIAPLRDRPLIELSGGQQQRVAIAAVLAAQPKILVLDEPTSALDPTAAQDVLSAMSMLVHEVGMTVLLAEHRLERVMHAADSMIWLSETGSAEYGKPTQLLRHTSVVPPLAALARIVGWDEVPLSVREARRRVQAEKIVPLLGAKRSTENPDKDTSAQATVIPQTVLQATGMSIRYGDTIAVNNIDLALNAGTVTAFMGRNGAGKSSLLWALAGGIPSTGTLSVGGQDPRNMTPEASRTLVTLVPQTAADLLYLPTVADELAQADKESHAEPGTALALLQSLGIELMLSLDPRDLSEGGRLALVLAIQLTARPKVVLLDEPTRGLDYLAKSQLGKVIRQLRDAGMAIAISTHDVEFAAAISTRTILMADGDLIADGETRTIVTSSASYSPQMAKVFAPLDVITTAEVAKGLA